MALIGELFHHVSLSTGLLALVAVMVLYHVCMRIGDSTKLKRLGSRAPTFPSYLPLSIDLLWHTYKAVRDRQMVEFWQSMFASIDSFTGEMSPAGGRIILTVDSENIRAIQATQFGDYGKGEQFHHTWNEFLNESLFTRDGGLWHDRRQQIRPWFAKNRVSDLLCFETHMQTLFKAIANGGALESEDQAVVDMKAVSGRFFDVSELFYRYTLDVATGFLLGNDVKSMSHSRNEFADAFTEVQRVQSLMVRTGPLRPLISKASFRRGLEVVNQYVNRCVQLVLSMTPDELAKANSDTSYSCIYALASITRDPTVLRDQLTAVLLAARDTSACALSWSLYELGRHPAAVARLRSEILTVMGPARTPTYADLRSMRYLQAIVNEINRLYPAVPFNSRVALRDTTLPRGGGPDGMSPVAVPRGTPVAYSVMVMHRREDLYPPGAEAGEFRPERWLDGSWKPQSWHYVPFHGGPRNCIGQHFAVAEMGYVLTRLFQRYGRVQTCMEEVDGVRTRIHPNIVLQPSGGVRVAFWEAEGGEA